MWRTFLLGVIGTLTFNYTPSAAEILSRMNATLRGAKPVQIQVDREDPHGRVLEEKTLTVPVPPGSTQDPGAFMDLSYATLTLPIEGLADSLQSLRSQNTKVVLGRLNGAICYVLEGENGRMWVSKNELLPLKIEAPHGEHTGTLYLYTNMIRLSGGARYPSRTEVWRDGELLVVEKLLTDTPPASGP